MKSFFIIGGAGFIGSHFVDRLLATPDVAGVTIYDNFSAGREWHFAPHRTDPRLSVVRADVHDMERLTESMAGHNVVIHLASNPDIARAAFDPDIDFREGTELTRNVVEAMRKTGCGHLLYASGSGVYGDCGETVADEAYSPMIPISTYGASKLAGEALIASYTYMFGLRACVFRFGNVVGARQTHGVAYDFLLRLRQNPAWLDILGDGRQSKPYVHVSDIVEAVLTAHDRTPQAFAAYNVGNGDYITVTDIARIVSKALGLTPELRYQGGSRGWKGDVPIVRLSSRKIEQLGWRPRYTCGQAIEASVRAMMEDLEAGRSLSTGTAP